MPGALPISHLVVPHNPSAFPSAPSLVTCVLVVWSPLDRLKETRKARYKMELDVIKELKRDPYVLYKRFRDYRPISEIQPGTWLLTKYDDIVSALNNPTMGHWWGNSHNVDTNPSLRLIQQFLDAISQSGNNALREKLIRRIVSVSSPPDDEMTSTAVVFDRASSALGQGQTLDIVTAICRPCATYAAATLFDFAGAQKEKLVDLLQLSHTRLNANNIVLDQDATLLPLTFHDLLNHSSNREIANAIADYLNRSGQFTATALMKCVELFLVATIDNLAGFYSNLAVRLVGDSSIFRPTDSLKLLCEEMLRMDPPIQIVVLRPHEDIRIRNNLISKGATVWAAIGAANRDPDRFSEPDIFQYDRSPNPHLSFGLGGYACVGASYARPRVRNFITALLTLARQYELEIVHSTIKTEPLIARHVCELLVRTKSRGSSPHERFFQHWRARAGL